MNMKNVTLFTLFLLFPLVTFSQAKTPTLMILPIDNWCNLEVEPDTNKGLKNGTV